ncbi:MAG: tyrosine-type recombinase/integrase [Spirochaetota bacterium]
MGYQEILDYIHATNTSAYNPTLFCTFTGCRFSEAAKLTWEYVDSGRGTALFIDTKNKEAREVYLSRNHHAPLRLRLTTWN